jgi:hypothetical protein
MEPHGMTDLLTVKEVARMLRVSIPGIYKMAHRKQIPCIQWESPKGENSSRAKTVLRFEPDAIVKFIEDHRR